MRKILITGVSSGIGRELACRLTAGRDYVWGISRSSAQHISNKKFQIILTRGRFDIIVPTKGLIVSPGGYPPRRAIPGKGHKRIIPAAPQQLVLHPTAALCLPLRLSTQVEAAGEAKRGGVRQARRRGRHSGQSCCLCGSAFPFSSFRKAFLY